MRFPHQPGVCARRRAGRPACDADRRRFRTASGAASDGTDRVRRRRARFRSPVRPAARSPRRCSSPTPSERNAPTSTGILARSPPSVIFTATQRPSGSAAQCTPSAPPFTSRPGIACISLVSSRPVPPTISGWARMASATCRSNVPSGGRVDRAEAPGQGDQRDGEQRGAAAVDPDRGRCLAGQPGDLVGDPQLQRVVGGQVAGGRPVVGDAGGQHAGVLAGAVHVDPPRAATGREHRQPVDLVHRQRRWAAEVVLGHLGAGQHGQRPLDVHRLAGVRRRRQRQVGADQIRAAGQHRDRLERLAGGPGEDRRPTRHRVGAAPSRRRR